MQTLVKLQSMESILLNKCLQSRKVSRIRGTSLRSERPWFWWAKIMRKYLLQ